MMRNYKTHCTWGHLFTDSNSYYDNNGYRSCKDCRRIRTAKERASNKLVQEPVYKSNTDIAMEIARAHYKYSYYSSVKYDQCVFYSVLVALKEIEHV